MLLSTFPTPREAPITTAFALRFIADMYAGKPFKEATRFTDKHKEGEKGIRRYISKWGHISSSLSFLYLS